MLGFGLLQPHLLSIAPATPLTNIQSAKAEDISFIGSPWIFKELFFYILILRIVFLKIYPQEFYKNLVSDIQIAN